MKRGNLVEYIVKNSLCATQIDLSVVRSVDLKQALPP